MREGASLLTTAWERGALPAALHSLVPALVLPPLLPPGGGVEGSNNGADSLLAPRFFVRFARHRRDELRPEGAGAFQRLCVAWARLEARLEGRSSGCAFEAPVCVRPAGHTRSTSVFTCY